MKRTSWITLGVLLWSWIGPGAGVAPAAAQDTAAAKPLPPTRAALGWPAPAALSPFPGAEHRYGRTAGQNPDLACTYTALSSGVPATATASPEYYIVNQTYGYWSAVGVRSQPGDDWDIRLYQSLGSDPVCVDGLLAGSVASTGVDFVVGDFNYSPLGPLYAEATRFAGMQDALVEWDDGPDILRPGDGPVVRTTGPDDVLETWDIYMQAGKEYGFLIQVGLDFPLPTMSMVLFENPSASPYFVGRSAAVLDTTSLDATFFRASFTAPASQWYGLVVVNENGDPSEYSVEVDTCAAPVTLASSVPQTVSFDVHHLSYTQSDIYWSIVALRPENSGQDVWWEVHDYSNGGGASWPTCFTNEVHDGRGACPDSDCIYVNVADFNPGHSATGTYYVEVLPQYHVPSPAGATVEWDGGADLAYVGGTTAHTVDPSEVVEMWDIYLQARVPYDFVLQGSGSARVLPALYSHASLGINWVTLFGTSATGGCASFSVDSTGYGGLTVFNMNGGSGSYQFNVFEQLAEEADPVVEDADDSRGAAWGDFDGDGDLDLYVAEYDGPNHLFVNNGLLGWSDGTVPPLDLGPGSLCGTWGDFDNDGDEDLAVSTNYGPLSLFRNDGAGTFTDVTTTPLDSVYAGGEVAWIDVDNDGRLDLWMANGVHSRIFRNLGGTDFVNATPAGIDSLWVESGAWADYDDDGDMDLYAVGPGSNHLFRNDGAFIMNDVTAAPLDDAGQGYNAAWGDFDNDGDLDLYLANNHESNRFFQNQGGGTFVDISSMVPDDGAGSRGACWSDFDNDGMLDLFVTNFGGRDRLFTLWGSSFVDRPATVLQPTLYTSGASWADFDGDGDQDLYLPVNTMSMGETNRLIRNDLCAFGSDASWLDVDLVGVLSNRDGIGARLSLYTSFIGPGSVVETRELTCQAGYESSGPSRVHFGVRPLYGVDSLVVRWPSGIRQTIGAPAPYQLITVTEDISSVSSVPAEAPAEFVLSPGAPNPFNPRTTIRYALPRQAPVRLSVYDVRGRLVRTLVDETQTAGRHTVEWNGTDARGNGVSSGIYFCLMESPGFHRTEKLTLTK